jgi:hypothetical protein
MTTIAIVALSTAIVATLGTILALFSLIVAGNADARNDARSHIGERLGGGRGVGHHGQEL